MRIAVDARVVQDRYHGIGRNTIELLRSIVASDTVELVLYAGDGRQTRSSVRELAGASGVRLVPFDEPITGITQQLRWPRLLAESRADVMLVPYHLATPWRSPVPVATMIHDCIFEDRPDFAPSRWMVKPYKLATQLALKRATMVLTVSYATRDSVRRTYKIEIPENNVVHHGVSPRFHAPCPPDEIERARAAYRLPSRYVLHVGVRRPHKNHATLLHAFASLRRTIPNVGLVLVGDADQRFPDPVPELCRSLGFGDEVVVIPEAEEGLMPAVYQSASAFAFPSFVEGFGLPVLEAMAAGVPVVASDVPAVAEAAEGAARLVRPGDAGAWAGALTDVLANSDVARDLRARGRRVSALRTWDATARTMLDALSALSRPGARAGG